MKLPSSGPPAHPRGAAGTYWPTSRPKLDLSRLRSAHLKDYAIRFLFGGSISVVAALLGHWGTPRFGGLFTAFPAILLASLTLIGKQEGREPSAEDAEGGAVGSIALVGTALFIAAMLAWLIGVASLLAALLLWLLLSLGLYLLCVKGGWLRTYPDQESRSSEQPTPKRP